MTESKPCCPACGVGNPSFLGSLPDSEWFAGKHLAIPLAGGFLFRCTQCWLKFRFPLESPETYRMLYDNATTSTWATSGRREDWNLILSEIESLKPQGGRILDFGCYTGGLLSRLEPRYQRFGIEINQHAANIAEEKASARVWPTIGDVPSDIRFDVIVLADVVEHVPNPKEVIELLGEKLDRNGVIIVTTGDAENHLWNQFGANWWYCFYPEHISFISKTWIQRIFGSRGWSIIDCRPFRYRGIGWMHRMRECVLAFAYGRLPRAYLNILRAIKRFSRYDTAPSIPGNGVSPDHLIVIISPRP